MDTAQLATDVTVFLAPYMPYLMAATGEIVKGAGRKVGENIATTVWEKIQSFSRRKAEMNAAATILSSNPKNEDYLLVFAGLLEQDIRISAELANVLESLINNAGTRQEITIQNQSRVNKIYQRLLQGGQSTTTVNNSDVDEITQIG